MICGKAAHEPTVRIGILYQSNQRLEKSLCEDTWHLCPWQSRKNITLDCFAFLNFSSRLHLPPSLRCRRLCKCYFGFQPTKNPLRSLGFALPKIRFFCRRFLSFCCEGKKKENAEKNDLIIKLTQFQMVYII